MMALKLSLARSYSLVESSWWILFNLIRWHLVKTNKTHLSNSSLQGDPFSSNRQHLSCGDCLEVRRKNNQNCSVLTCVWQLCIMIYAHICKDLLNLLAGVGFVFVCLFMLSIYCVFCIILHYFFFIACFCYVMLVLVSSVPSQEIGWEERLRNGSFYVKWNVKSQWINHGEFTGWKHN